MTIARRFEIGPAFALAVVCAALATPGCAGTAAQEAVTRRNASDEQASVDRQSEFLRTGVPRKMFQY